MRTKNRFYTLLIALLAAVTMAACSGGSTASFLSGYDYDGYLRGNTPVGPKVDLGHEDNTRGNYGFQDDMRKFHVGLNLGVDVKVYKQLGVFADLAWGLNGIFKKDFKTVEQTLYPIYATLGIVYQIK